MADPGGDGGAAFKAFEAEGWSRQAETYGDLTGAVTSRVAEQLLDAAGVRHGMRVLDVATGPGYAAERAASRGATPLGIDIAEEMLAVARRRHPELDFRLADAEELPFDDASFEAVVGGFVVNHLPRPETAVGEFARVLRPGGGIAISTWDRPERMRLIGVTSEAIDAAGIDRTAELPDGPDPYRFAEDPALTALLEEAGFEQATVEEVSFSQAVESTEALWSGFMGSSVRTSAVIRAQASETVERIRAELERTVEPYRVGERLELPIVAKLGSARKPE